MKYFTCLAFVFILFSACNGDKEAKVTIDSYYRIAGTNIIDPSGDTIQLKGTNLGHWLHPEGYMFKFRKVNSAERIDRALKEMLGPEAAREFWDEFLANYVQEEDIRFLKEVGLNHVRVPFNYRMLTSESYLGREDHGFRYLDSVITWCRESELGVVLDMHAAPGGQTGDNIDDSYGYPYLFIEETSQDKTINLWREIAERYKDEEVVIGYDLLNEPIAHYFVQDSVLLHPELEKLYKRIVEAIREVDPHHLVFLGGAQWNTNFNVFGPPFDDKAVYTFHKYWMPPEKEQIQEYIDFRDKYKVPIYMGESGENSDDWVNQFRTLLDDNRIHWCFWPYKKMDATSCIMNFNRPNGYDKVIQFVEGERSTFESIREIIPDRDSVLLIMDDYLAGAIFSNGFENTGYMKALGLDAERVE